MIFESFMGALTPYGFVGHFDSLCEARLPLRLFIIKGGPGCGKSSTMKRIAERLTVAGHDVELVHCSSDPASLDGVICPSLGFAVADGTAPHIIEPILPVAGQNVISLYDFIDENISLHADELRELFSKNARCFTRANRFISASASLYGDLVRTSSGFLVSKKLDDYIKGICERLFPKEDSVKGGEEIRFLCAPTPEGLTSFFSKNLATCNYRYVIKDRFCAFGHAALEQIRSEALSRGLDIVTSRSFLSPNDKIDAIFISSLSLCFVLSSFLSPIGTRGCRVINDERFYDKAEAKKYSARIGFIKKTTLSLLCEGCEIIREAKTVHDEIEKIYTKSFDFEPLRDIVEKICGKYGV